MSTSVGECVCVCVSGCTGGGGDLLCLPKTRESAQINSPKGGPNRLLL